MRPWAGPSSAACSAPPAPPCYLYLWCSASFMAAGPPRPPGAAPSLEKLMPDKNPDAGPSPVDTGKGKDGGESLLRHTTPPGLMRFGKLALIAAVAVAGVGIGWRLWKSHTTAQW